MLMSSPGMGILVEFYHARSMRCDKTFAAGVRWPIYSTPKLGIPVISPGRCWFIPLDGSSPSTAWFLIFAMICYSDCQCSILTFAVMLSKCSPSGSLPRKEILAESSLMQVDGPEYAIIYLLASENDFRILAMPS